MPSHLSIISLFTGTPYDSSNVLYLGAALKKHGLPHTVIFHLRRRKNSYWHTSGVLLTEKEIALLLAGLKESGADVAGISVYYHFFAAASQLTARIKKDLGIPVVWGGVYPTIAPEECLAHADMVCRGDGEELVVELMRRFSGKEDLSGLPGLWIKDGEGRVVKNPLRFPQPELDTLAFPFLDEETARYICEDDAGWKPKPMHACRVAASRGCYFSCTYCSEHIIKRECQEKYAYRVRTPQNVIDELKEAVLRFHPRLFTFDEPMFPPESPWVREFCRLYKEQVRLPFYIRTHPRFITGEHLDLLTEAGLYHINTAIESGSERVRRQVFRRPESNAVYLEMRKAVLAHQRLSSSYNLILDNPFEDATDYRQALDFILSIPGRYFLVLFTLNFFPKTDLTARALQEKKIGDYHLSQAARLDGVEIRWDYRRTPAEQHWCACLCLAALRSLFGFPGRRFILAAYASRLLKKHPFFFFLLCWFSHSVIIKMYRTIARLTRK